MLEKLKLLNGEIINGDSMQVYKEMNIGTAKITEEEKDGVIHHLFDVVSINEEFSVAQFQKILREKLLEITNKGKLPIIVGGTGLYLKAGLYDYNFVDKENVDYGFDNKTNEELYDLLNKLDPNTASTIHPNNKKRVIRALELYYENNGEGKIDLIKKQTKSPIYNVLYIGLTRDRKHLYELIDQRVNEMIANGLVDEARLIYENATSITARQAIGYKELFKYFEGEYSLDEAIYKIKMNTHKFVKRQYTWFNHQVDVHWIDIENKEFNQVIDESEILIKGWLYE